MKLRKIYYIVSCIFMIPAFLNMMLFGLIAMDFYIGHGEFIQSFIQGQSNNKFICISCMLSIVGIIMQLPIYLDGFQNSNTIEELNKEKQEYAEATRKMIKVRDEYTDLIKNKL